MAFTWGILAVAAVGLILGLIYRSARSRREYLVLAFTDRIGLPVTPEIVDRVDRRIRDGYIGFSLGALVALVTFGMVVLVAPQLVPTGLAGFAVSGVLMAAPATGGALSTLRQFPLRGGSGTSRVARLEAPTLTDYVNPGWVWAATGGTAFGASLTIGLVTGALPTNPGNAGLPLGGVVALSVLSIVGLIGVVVLSRQLLTISQPAATELELQWDDALRASALRDIWIASIGLATATIVSACSWVLDMSSPSYYAIMLLGTAPMILLSLPVSNRSSRRLWQHSLATS
ncbi:hypothetical protein AB4Y63_06705 [Leifsonia sp. YAF41]|uniref:hypothetical protein n=1 Tax=Leifsonia sp. YAF41 TaxID=3233086 RepID=UPI003F9D8F95